MVSFADGAVLDEFQLHKPVNWQADPDGQAAFLSSFNDTYAETWLENPGKLSNVCDMHAFSTFCTLPPMAGVSLHLACLASVPLHKIYTSRCRGLYRRVLPFMTCRHGMLCST